MDAFVREAFALLGIGLFVIGLRLYVRISSSGFTRLHADDYLMVVAAASTPVRHELASTLLTLHSGGLLRRDLPRLLGRVVLERACQQRHDGRAARTAGST